MHTLPFGDYSSEKRVQKMQVLSVQKSTDFKLVLVIIPGKEGNPGKLLLDSLSALLLLEEIS